MPIDYAANEDVGAQVYSNDEVRTLLAAHGQRSGAKAKTGPAPSRFVSLLNDAASQVGVRQFLNHDDTVRATIKKPAASADHIMLGELDLPALGNNDRRTVHFPRGTEAGKVSKLNTALLRNSRVAAAGARIIPVPEPAVGVMVDGVTVYPAQRMRFDLIEAADFATVPDGDDAAESSLPLYTAPINIGETPNLCFRVKLTRAERRAYEAGYLEDAALGSIGLGLARAADKVLLEAIAAAVPGAFNLGAAAARGFEFSELRALVGSDGAGGVVGQDGTLRAAGVLAELTPVMPGTFVGSFSRSAVAIGERITFTAERINLRSDLNLLCWANMEALVPMPGAFWTVAA